MMATANHLSSVENIQAVYLMELKILKFAKKNSFNAIVSTDANQLVQQIHESILGYKVLKEFQVNRYKDKEGNLPFKNATDSLKTKTMWKQIDNE